MKNNDGKSEDNAKLKNLKRIFKNEDKLKLKIFNFGWWRNPPYKKAYFRHRVQLS